MANIVFIGLGNMGAPMAGHLSVAGHRVYIANRSPEKIDSWLRKYAGETLRGTTLPPDIDLVILCVSRDSDVKEWLIDNGIINQLKPGALIIDHSTTSAELAESMARIAKKAGIFFCDVPVSGGQQGAQSGQLSLMVGCYDGVFDHLKTITAPYTKAIERMGPPGSGQKTKMVNQICVAGLIEALAEGVHFAEKSGLDTKKVMQLVSQGAGSSWQLLNRHQTMIDNEYDHGFAISLMHKDLQICLEEARKIGADLPVTQIVDHYYEELENNGHGQKDTSALLLRLKDT